MHKWFSVQVLHVVKAHKQNFLPFRSHHVQHSAFSVCMYACLVTAMENGMRASEMTKAIFSVWQAQAHLDEEEGR